MKGTSWRSVRNTSVFTHISNVEFLELYVRNLEFEQEFADGRAIESSHLLFKQPGARLNADPILHCLRCLHKIDKGIFGLTLNPRHVGVWGTLLVLLQGINGSFRCKENAKGPYTDSACPSVYCLHEFSTWWKLHTRSTTRCTTGIAPVAWLLPPIRSILYYRLGIIILFMHNNLWFHFTIVFFGVWGGLRMGVPEW